MLHRVYVTYAPEADEKFSTEERLTFSNEKNAREFRARQDKKENVLSTRLCQIAGSDVHSDGDREDET